VHVRLRLALARFELDFALDTDARSIGIFGPSGAGKTSALEAIAGWRSVRDGRVELGGRTLLDTERAIDVAKSERGIGYVPQDALLFPHWSVERNIRCGERRREDARERALAAPSVSAREVGSASARDVSRDEAHELGRNAAREFDHDAAREFDRAVAVLELGPLLARRTTSLSGGERQRVALARALCSRPRFLLLDEPLGALDVPLRRRILPYLIRVRETFDVPMLFVTHDATEVQALCDEVAVMSAGRIVEIGNPSAIFGRAAAGRGGFENVMRGTVTDASGGTARIAVARGVEVIVPGTGLAVGQHAFFSLGEDDILVSKAPIAGISARNILAARVETLSIDGDDALLVAALDPTSTDARSSHERSSHARSSSSDVGENEARVTEAIERASSSIGEHSGIARLRVRLTRASARELALEPLARVHLVFKTQSCRVLSV
jgi:molybdate transport system ATP-binding protein